VASDLMSREVVAVDKDERLEQVIGTMRKGRMSKLPVVEDGKLVGIVTDGDIADEIGALKNRGVPPSHLHASSAMRRVFATCEPPTPAARVVELMLESDVGLVPVVHEHTLLGVITASDLLRLVRSDRALQDVMTTHVHAVEATDRVIHARRIMVDHHIERLPVLAGGRLVGIVGEMDIAAGLARFKSEVRDKHQPAALQRFLVEDVYQRQVVTATPDTRARDAAERMVKEDVGSLPVLRGDRLVGMVTRSDLLRTIPLEPRAAGAAVRQG
jgi:CBS domain-containing protein